MKKLTKIINKINSYTDESGQDTSGKVFVVATVVVSADSAELIENKLLKIEKISNKTQKWYDSGFIRRRDYIKLLLKEKILLKIDILYSRFENKADYVVLISSHIAKAILTSVGDTDYLSKVFVDKMDKKTHQRIAKEIKTYHIRYKKISRLSDQNSALIRLADAICGLVRDMDNKNVASCYKDLFSKLKKI